MEWDCHICNRCQTTFATDRELPTPEEGHLDLEGWVDGGECEVCAAQREAGKWEEDQESRRIRAENSKKSREKSRLYRQKYPDRAKASREREKAKKHAQKNQGSGSQQTAEYMEPSTHHNRLAVARQGTSTRDVELKMQTKLREETQKKQQEQDRKIQESRMKELKLAKEKQDKARKDEEQKRLKVQQEYEKKQREAAKAARKKQEQAVKDEEARRKRMAKESKPTKPVAKPGLLPPKTKQAPNGLVHRPKKK
jgi:hypothetical protein